HGTTLAGLMKEHGVDPHHFLDDVHDIALDRVGPNHRLAAGLGRLPGRKFVFTNGDAPYARRVLERIGIGDQFEHLHDIHACELRPKPQAHGYELLCRQFGIDPATACMVEDMAQNLRPAKALGMTTVWVDNGSERGNHDFDPGHVDLRIAELRDYFSPRAGSAWQSWAIVRHGAQQAIGFVSAGRKRDGVSEIGYLLAREAHGQGYGREAVSLLIDHLLAHGDRRIFADVDPDNRASIALLTALGFTLEGRLRAEWQTHIGVRDSLIYGLLAEEWPARSAA
ncbi:MAG: GNAT family N-acetyltransferase, partial [Sphingomonas sp.]